MIPFTAPSISATELDYVRQALAQGDLQGDGAFTKACNQWLSKSTRAHAILTHSCTAALEMATLIAGLKPGDEVIMPSFTFVSTANAIVLRGAIPVFIDIRPDTLNIDEQKIADAVGPATRAIMAVHYAGVCAHMDPIIDLARDANLFVLEDAAQALLSTYRSRPAGSLGDMGCFSFHETKNITSGEGGALVLKDEKFLERAYTIRDKGTNRQDFLHGKVDKYTWVDIGSSYLPSDILAALLLAQLERAEEITKRRLSAWHVYHDALHALESRGCLVRPTIPEDCEHNGHIYYLLTRSQQERTKLLEHLRAAGITATFHFQPLHSSPAGVRYGRVGGTMQITDDVAGRLIRLPIFDGIAPHQDKIISKIYAFYGVTP